MPQFAFRFGLTICFGLLLIQGMNGQQKSWRQYTTADGLPSMVVYDLLRDRLGYMWMVTEQGICRFNGYTFQSPVDTSAYAGTETFLPTEDQHGRIWFARLDASLWYIEDDTVRAWKHNHVIDSFRSMFQIIDQLGIDEDGSVWMGINGLGFLVISTYGIAELKRFADNQNIAFTKIRNKTIFVTQHKDETKRREASGYIQKTEVFYLTLSGLVNVFSEDLDTRNTQYINVVCELENEEFILNTADHIFYIKNNELQKSVPATIQAEKIIRLPDGQILAAAHQGPQTGLMAYSSISHLLNGDGINFLPQHKATSIEVDREGGWWTSPDHAGVFYCKNPGVEIYGKAVGFESDDVVRLSTDGQQYVYAGFRPSSVWAIDTDLGKVNNLKAPALNSKEVWDIEFDTNHKVLWTVAPLSYMDAHGSWKRSDWNIYQESTQRELILKEISLSLSGQELYGSSISGFCKIDVLQKKTTWIRRSEVDEPLVRTFAIIPRKSNQLWEASAAGLRLWHNDKIIPLPFQHPLLKRNPRKIKALPGGGLVMGIPEAGILIWNNDESLTHLSRVDGLTSDIPSEIYVESDTSVFVCSNAGLNHLKQTQGRWKVIRITTHQGLPSNQVNDVVKLKGELWIATDQGLVHLPSIPLPFRMEAPVIQKMTVNHRAAIREEGMRLQYDQNNLSISYFALHYRSDGDITYRYMVHGADTIWTVTPTTLVHFANLAPGEYRFEVQAQNEDLSWGPSSTWTFSIRPPWWRTWWFVSLLGIGTIAVLWSIYRVRINTIKEKTTFTNKIKDLEMAALRAQMNPHFIFNCLGSIQQFIAENDKASATSYLAKFAKLIRLSLHSSVDGRHSLSEEVEMLDHYLALEQMRFKEKFTYSIETKGIDQPEEIYLPPMLIQPFVENAVIHGMKSHTRDGKIQIEFQLHSSFLIVWVTDNGPGMASPAAAISNHKSMGKTLTMRRLNLLSNQALKGNFTMDNLTDAAGTIQGTRVEIRIPLE